jgi:hypothetical protein
MFTPSMATVVFANAMLSAFLLLIVSCCGKTTTDVTLASSTGLQAGSCNLSERC